MSLGLLVLRKFFLSWCPGQLFRDHTHLTPSKPLLPTLKVEKLTFLNIDEGVYKDQNLSRAYFSLLQNQRQSASAADVISAACKRQPGPCQVATDNREGCPLSQS